MASGIINGTATVSSGSTIFVRVSWSSSQAKDQNGQLIENTSTVTARYQMKRAAPNFSDKSTFFVIINGDRKNDTNGYTYPNNDTWQTIMSHSVNVLHNTNGSGSAVISAGGVNTGTSWSTGSVPSTSVTLDNFVRLPSTPSSAPTMVRPVSGLPTTITITSGTSTFFGSSPDYKLQISTNNVNWTSVTGLANAETSMGSDRIYTWTSAVATTGYWFRTRAVDTEGGSSYSGSSFVAGAPGTPTGLTVSKNASFPKRRDLSWTAPSNNGATITSYTIQARYSSNGGVTWDNDYTTLGTSATTSFATSDLEIAKTYQFRVAATNSSGTGAYVATVSPFTFISAYGYIFQLAGANLVPVAIQNLKIYVGVGGPGADANGWRVAQNVKKYTASGWIDLQT
jgi:hypothetical protein